MIASRLSPAAARVCVESERAGRIFRISLRDGKRASNALLNGYSFSQRATSLLRAGALLQLQSAGGLRFFLSVLARGEEAFARVEAERAGAEGYVALRVGYHDAGLAEEAGDVVVDVAAYGDV